MSDHAPALADIRSDVSRRHRSAPIGPPGASPSTGRPCALDPEESRRRIVATCSQSGMGWNEIPQARSPVTDASATRQVSGQNRENNPMQSRMAWLAALRPLASGSREWSVVMAQPIAPKPRDGAGRDACPVLQTESPDASGANAMLSPEPLSMRRRSGPPCRSPNCCAPGCNAALIHGRRGER